MIHLFQEIARRVRPWGLPAVLAMLSACAPAPDDPSSARAASAGSAPASVDDVPSSLARGDAPAAPLAREPAASDVNVGDLRQEVTLLRREVRDLREQVQRLPGGHEVAANTPDPRTDAVARDAALQAERLRIATSEAAFQNERSDSRWAQGERANIQASLAQAGDTVRNQVRSIECRSQSCRVEINAGAGDAVAQQLPMVITQLGQSLPNVTAGQVDQGDGRQATVLYMSR